jgi:hypothetical protein
MIKVTKFLTKRKSDVTGKIRNIYTTKVYFMGVLIWVYHNDL